jgi:hypothetical protein
MRFVITTLLALSTSANALCIQTTNSCVELNADVTQETLQQTVCTPGYTASVRPSASFTNGVKLKLLRERGEPPENASLYQLDHLIPLAIGGHPRSLTNLWLQPLKGDNGAKSKDKLEVKLQCLVCAGHLQLAEAQHLIAEDWKAARQQLGHKKCNRNANYGPAD